MKRMYHGIKRKWQIPLMIMSGILPVIVLWFCVLPGSFVPYAWIFAGAYLILAIFSLAVPGKWRLVYGLCSMGLMLALGIFLTARTGSFSMAAASGIFCVALLWGIQIARWEWYDEIPLAAMLLGLGIQIAAQFLLAGMKDSGYAQLQLAESSILDLYADGISAYEP